MIAFRDPLIPELEYRMDVDKNELDVYVCPYYRCPIKHINFVSGVVLFGFGFLLGSLIMLGVALWVVS